MARPVFLLILLFCCSAQAGTNGIPADKEIIEFDSKFGDISFAHKSHSMLNNVDCRTCHHTYPEDQGMQDCHNCHRAGADDTPESKEAFHLRCRGCHKYTVESGGKAGPVTKCRLCHQ